MKTKGTRQRGRLNTWWDCVKEEFKPVPSVKPSTLKLMLEQTFTGWAYFLSPNRQRNIVTNYRTVKVVFHDFPGPDDYRLVADARERRLLPQKPDMRHYPDPQHLW